MADNSNTLNDSVHSMLIKLGNELGFDRIAAGPLHTPVTMAFYDKWLAQSYHGNMHYLQDHRDKKAQPTLIQENLRSAIAVSHRYFPAPRPHPNKLPARIATYARNEDYHFWMRTKLQQLVDSLKLKFPQNQFLAYVDSGPVLERDLAQRLGLGWFGKNTCLIHPKDGSLFFIAEILTDLEVSISEPAQPLPDFCGTCNKCIEVCPTQALIEPRVLRADRCISYLTIEEKGAPPPELRDKIGDWFFGCDLCQTVCPWNRKVFRSLSLENEKGTEIEVRLTPSAEERSALIEYFRFLFTASHNRILKFHEGSALTRAGAKGLKKNALIVSANMELFELAPEIRGATGVDEELRDWTLKKLKTPT